MGGIMSSFLPEAQNATASLSNVLGYQNTLAYNQYCQDYRQSYQGLMPSNNLIPPTPNGDKNMITEVAQDMKQFIKSNKSTIYWIAMLLMIDHFFFHGAFKERLSKTMNDFIGKVESKLSETKV